MNKMIKHLQLIQFTIILAFSTWSVKTNAQECGFTIAEIEYMLKCSSTELDKLAEKRAFIFDHNETTKFLFCDEYALIVDFVTRTIRISIRMKRNYEKILQSCIDFNYKKEKIESGPTITLKRLPYLIVAKEEKHKEEGDEDKYIINFIKTSLEHEQSTNQKNDKPKANQSSQTSTSRFTPCEEMEISTSIQLGSEMADHDTPEKYTGMFTNKSVRLSDRAIMYLTKLSRKPFKASEDAFQFSGVLSGNNLLGKWDIIGKKEVRNCKTVLEFIGYVYLDEGLNAFPKGTKAPITFLLEFLPKGKFKGTYTVGKFKYSSVEQYGEIISD